jgi:hypothetical protein
VTDDAVEKESSEEREDLQTPLVHEGAPSEQYDGNEDADDRVEVVEPDGHTTPRVANKEGRSPDVHEPGEPDREDTP